MAILPTQIPEQYEQEVCERFRLRHQQQNNKKQCQLTNGMNPSIINGAILINIVAPSACTQLNNKRNTAQPMKTTRDNQPEKKKNVEQTHTLPEEIRRPYRSARHNDHHDAHVHVHVHVRDRDHCRNRAKPICPVLIRNVFGFFLYIKQHHIKRKKKTKSKFIQHLLPLLHVHLHVLLQSPPSRDYHG
jgi:hypothetical protein